MKKIVFITSRNIINTCGELRLIKSRAYTLRNEFNIETIFFCFVNEKKLSKHREMFYSNCTINIYTYSTNDILKSIINFSRFTKDIIKFLEISKITNIIISGIFPINLSKYLKKKFANLQITLDIHSANEEILEFRSKSLLNILLFNYFEFYTFNTLKYVDSALVVSNALMENILEKKKNISIVFFIIPCTLVKKIDKYDEMLFLRNKWRENFQIKKDEVLFIYSGGTSPWQSIDDTKKIYDLLKTKMKVKSKFLIMTNNIEKLTHLLKFDDLIIKSFNSDQVEEILFAGDVAFLIRGDYITNNVAFPNKFFEYVLSNMFIISTPYIYDVSKLIIENNLGLILKENLNLKDVNLSQIILTNMDSFNEYKKRIKFINSMSFEELLIPYVEYISN